jgi:type VI secretion system secreted protein VgrG
VDYLQQQVAILKKELGALKLMIKRAPDGSMLVTATPNKQEQIQRNESINVGVNRHLQIGDSDSIEIGRNQIQSVGQNMTLEVGKDLNVAAGDEFRLKTGKASIVLRKDGNIRIVGKDIMIQGSGHVYVKGPNVNID